MGESKESSRFESFRTRLHDIWIGSRIYSMKDLGPVESRKMIEIRERIRTIVSIYIGAILLYFVDILTFNSISVLTGIIGFIGVYSLFESCSEVLQVFEQIGVQQRQSDDEDEFLL